MPARRLVVVARAGGVDPRLEHATILGVQAQDLGEPRPGVGVVWDGLPVAVVHRTRARHHPAGHDLDVVGRTAGREHFASRVADHAARRRQNDAANDVLVRDGRILGPVENLELKEATRDHGKRQQGG